MEKHLNRPNLDETKCNRCGLCIEVCACHSFVLVDSVLQCVETAECDLCLQCEMVCPTGAVTFSFEVVIDEE